MGWNKNADANVSTITNTSTNGIGIGGDDLEHQSLWTIDSDSDNEYGDKDICQMQSQSVMIGPNGDTCQPVDCLLDDFMELVKGQFADECHVHVLFCESA